jgi:hypothetical protein
MKRSILYSIVGLSMLAFGGIGIAQQNINTTKLPVQMAIPPSAKLSMGSSELKFSLFQGEGKDRKLAPKTVDTLWINYSSVVVNNTTNTICASLASGDLPAEIAIKLKVGPDVGAGNGQVGKPTLPIYLSTAPQAIITDIGSCFTGQGNYKGHLLTFSWELKPGYDPDYIQNELLSHLRMRVIYTINSDE